MRLKLCCSTIMLAALSFTGTLFAQTVNVLVPTTDVEPAKTVTGEVDALVNPRSTADGGWDFGLVRIIGSLSPKVELGVNVMASRGGGFANPTELQPNIKYQFYSDSKSRVAAAVGAEMWIPIWHPRYGNNFAWGYANVSKRFLRDTGPRLTGGLWGTVNRMGGTGSKSGGFAGLDYPFADFTKNKFFGKMSSVSDWMSGNQVHGAFSSASTGLNYAFNSKYYLLTGYTWGNTGARNNGFLVFVGRNLGGTTP